MLQKQPVHVLLILMLGLLVYSNTFNVPFQFDDRGYIVDNPIIKDFKYFENPFAAGKPHGSFYSYSFKNRFISDFTFALNYKIHGLNVTGYHVVNLVIHLVNALLVYWLVLLTLRKVSEGHDSLSTVNGQQSTNLIAFFSALIFVSHPVQTEAVTYIYQRFTSLASLFYLLSLVLYVKFRMQDSGCRIQNKKSKNCASCILYLASLACAVLAMKTKEIAFTLPIIIVLYEFCFFTETLNSKLLTFNFKRFLYLLPFLLTLLIIPLSYTGINKSGADLLHVIDKAARTSAIPRMDYLFTQFSVIVTYLRLLFFPVNQNLDYDYPIYNSFLNPNVFLSFLFLLSFFVLAVYLFYRSKNPPSSPFYKGGIKGGCSLFTIHYSRLIAFGIFWFFITLSVESSVIPLEDVIFEHRLYLPGIGLIFAFVSFVFYAFSRLTFRLSLATCYLLLTTSVILLSIASYQRNALWQNEIALWEDIAKKSPGKARVHSNLGTLYLANGMTDKAVSEFKQAISINPDYIEARKNLITAYLNKEALDDALGELITLSNLLPGNADILTPIGGIYIKKGEPDKAIEHLNQALLLNPQHVNALTNLGIAYASKGWDDKALSAFDSAVGINRDFAFAYYNRGLIYEKKRDYSKAAVNFKLACLLGHEDGCAASKTALEGKQ